MKVPKTAKPGATVTGTVEVTFAEGLHGYQNPPTTPDLIPIVLTVDTKDVKLKPVTYPAGKSEKVAGSNTAVMVYEGTIKIPVKVVLPKKHGKLSVAFKLSYQQCNASSCYPPSDVSASAPITVK